MIYLARYNFKFNPRYLARYNLSFNPSPEIHPARYNFNFNPRYTLLGGPRFGVSLYYKTIEIHLARNNQSKVHLS